MLDINFLMLAAVITVIIFLYKYITQDSGYFADKPFPHLKSKFLFGNSWEMMMRRDSLPGFLQKIYKKFPEAKFLGFFDLLTPVYMVRDLDCLKRITVKDFDYFQDHRSILGDQNDPGESLFGNSLFSLTGQKWRDMRATLSPAFTGSKMRQMFQLVSECARDMSEFFLNEARTKGHQEHEMKDVFCRFANDVIATTAFGLKVDSFKERDNEFFVTGKQLINFNTAKVLFKLFAFRICPKLMVKLGIDFSDTKLSYYFKNMILETIKIREAENIIRPDMINLLIQLKKGDKPKDQQEEQNEEKGFATVEESNVGKTQVTRKWSENELISQCFLFFLAGFDTVSTGLTFLAYELIANPDVQQQLYEEVKEMNENLGGKPLTYDALQKMTYMDMVVSETLRKWPPAPVVDRQCIKDYVYDDENGMKFKIEKGKIVWIPIYGLHHDERYFPNPDKFDPERFNDENKGNINAAAYVPFGVGPRNCIGSRFALMEVKSVIYYLLLNFSFEVTEKSQIPLKLQNTFIGMVPEKGVHLEFKPRH